MNIIDIAIAKQLAGGGGGSGTDSYNDLSNLPKINDVTLSGNKSSSALGLQSEITSDSKLASDLVDDTNQDNKFVTSTEKNTWNGKQNAIDADHKINADYVDDSTSTNKFVTASDKETWNAKQNAIDNSHKLSSDLVDDANHTNKFVTSTEKQTWNAKQNAIDADHKLSSSLVSFTTAEAAALASGIDSTKVAQISTNQSNILYVAENGVKNVFPVASGTTSHSDGTLFDKIALHLSAGSWDFSWTSTATPTAGTVVAYDSNKTEITRISVPSGSTSFSGTLTLSQDAYYATLYVGIDTTVSNIMCKPSWMSNDYQPPSLPNYDLTRLEAEDRASLAEVVDSGAKNVWDFANAIYGLENNITQTKTASDLTVSSSAVGGWSYVSYGVFLPVGNYVLSFKISNLTRPSGSNPMIRVATSQNGDSLRGQVDIASNGQYSFEFNIESAGTYYVIFGANWIGTPYEVSYKASDLMVATKAAFGVSNKFVPFGNDPFYQVPINHNMIYRGRNLGASLTDAQHTALSSGNFTDLYLGDYWTKTVTIPAGTYTGGDDQEVTVPAQTNITLKAVIADFDTFYAGYASSYAGINTHHAAVIVTGFSNVVWNKTNSTAGGYVASLIHKWLVGSALPQIETWFGSAKVLSHQKLLTNAITGDAASGWAWSSQKISLLSENQMYGSKVWGNSKAYNGGYEPGEAFKHLNVFNHIDANLLFGNRNIWLRDIASAVWAAYLYDYGNACSDVASNAGIAPAALILLS